MLSYFNCFIWFFRGNQLIASGELHRFFDAVRKAEARSVDMLTQINAHEEPESVVKADSLIANHIEKLAEIDGRQVLIFSFCLAV